MELATAHAREGEEVVERLLAAGSLREPLEDKLRLFVRAMIDNHRDDPALHRELFEQAPRPPGLVELLHDVEERVVVAVAGLLAADSQVRVSDTDMAARLVVGSVEGLVHRFTASGILGDLGRFETELVAMLTRYLTARRI